MDAVSEKPALVGGKLQGLNEKILYLSNRQLENAEDIATLNESLNSCRISLKELSDWQVDHQNVLVELRAETKAVGKYAGDVLAVGNNVLAGADALVTVYLFWVSVIVTVVATSLGLWFSKTKRDYLKEASDEVIERLGQDAGLTDRLVTAIVASPNLRDNLNTAIDLAAKDVAKQNHGVNGVLAEAMREMAAGLDKGDEKDG